MALSIAALLCGCNIDSGWSCRPVSGDYCLERWEDGKTYYLRDKRHPDLSGGGVIDGVVQRIGWTDSTIIAWRKPLFGGDPWGWMVIDVRRRSVEGPISDAERVRRPDLRSIAVTSPEIAWPHLRWFRTVQVPAR